MFDIKLNEAADDLAIKVAPRYASRKRSAWSHSQLTIIDPNLGVPLLSLFTPNKNSQANMVAAIHHRFGRKMPGVHGDVEDDFSRYARSFILLMNPVNPNDLMTREQWLDTTPYNQVRKNQLLDLATQAACIEPSDFDCQMFIKTEGYPEYKWPRAINSFSDLTKVIWGPLCHAIDHSTFETINGNSERWFMKFTNPKTWSAELESMFGEGRVMTTDFSSFEAHHRGVFSRVIYFWMMHMARPCLPTNAMKRSFAQAILGTHVCKGMGVTATLNERLMSGAMWTSSSNGMLNLLITSYLVKRSENPLMDACELAALAHKNFKMKAEGDDGITLVDRVDESLIQRLGISLDFKYHQSYRTAKFCSILCAEGTSAIIKDPLKTLRSYFVIPNSVPNENRARHYLRAKSLSFKYCFNDSPIVGWLAHRVCYLTRDCDVSSAKASCELTSWQKMHLESAIADKIWLREPDPTPAMYELVEEVFGIPVAHQLEIEHDIKMWDGLKPLALDLSRYASFDDYGNSLLWSEHDPYGGTWTTHPVIQAIVDGGRRPVGRPHRTKAPYIAVDVL